MGIKAEHYNIYHTGAIIEPIDNFDKSLKCEECFKIERQTLATNFFTRPFNEEDARLFDYYPAPGQRRHVALCGQHAEAQEGVEAVFIWDDRDNLVRIR